MKHIVCMGEMLIDFIPNEKGLKLKDVTGFTKYPGGAPANVCVAAKKSGVDAYFVGQVGADGFGDFLIDTLKNENIDTRFIHQTHKAKTALAYVSLTNEGERDFIFYRDPSADQLYKTSQVPTHILKNSIFHYCSVSLSPYPIKNAHLKAIKFAKEHDGFISFDPNLRLSLWSDHEAYKKVINEFIPLSDLLKVSNDELEFITGEKILEKALSKLFVGDVKYVIITSGKDGATLYYKDLTYVQVDGFKVTPVDTTGAGDVFIGSFLSEIAKHNLSFDRDIVREALKTANVKAALTTTKYGGISAIPTEVEYLNFIQSQDEKNKIIE